MRASVRHRHHRLRHPWPTKYRPCARQERLMSNPISTFCWMPAPNSSPAWRRRSVTVALSGMNVVPDSPWTDPLSSEEQYAMEEQVDMDEIDMDELGDATLASLESPVDAGELQETRAGFVLNNGVHIDFAVTRLTSVDGLDQLHTITNMPQGLDSTALGQISAGQAGNARVLSPNVGSTFSVIQNNLDNQRILDVTTIDVGIRNFGLRSTNFIPQSLQGTGGMIPELQR